MAGAAARDYTPVPRNDSEGFDREPSDRESAAAPLIRSSLARPPLQDDAVENEDAPFIVRSKSPDADLDSLDDPLANDIDRITALQEKEETKSAGYLFLLALSIIGLQICWTTELSNGSPFLLSLGLSKSVLSFVWIAGPLMGVLVQPYVGILSDRSRSRWGKRRPFMVAGAVGTAISFMALAWSQSIIGGVLGIFGASPDSHGVKVTIIVWAVTWVYVLDFAINAVQAAIRAFIVDNAPTHQQEDANAWASRLTGFGSILGYLSGYVDLPRYFPIFGDSQFKVLSMFASLMICSTVLISCLYIKERAPDLDGAPERLEPLGLVSFFKQTLRSIKRLPPQIRKVCEVQFFNWMGWFPFLFYITTYIGQLYVNPIFEAHPNLPKDEVDQHWEIATRVGSLALFINSCVAFFASIVLPFLVVPSYRAAMPEGVEQSTGFLSRAEALLRRLRVPHFTLRRAWLLSHVFFAICMAGTFFAASPASGTVIVALLGLSWAVTMWAPFALVSAEISKRETLRRQRQSARRRFRNEGNDAALEIIEENSHDSEDQAGVILGLHNVSVSLPQIIATLISSGIFELLQRERGTAGDDSVGWVLRCGGVAALIAAFMTWRLKEEAEESVPEVLTVEEG